MANLKTRETLLLKLRDPADDSAWGEFVELYTPVLYSFLQKRGASHHDIVDLIQDVMRSVASAMPSFEYKPERGTFRSWLFTVARNRWATWFKKSRRSPLESDLDIENEPAAEEVDAWEADYQRRLLHWAAGKVRPEFSDRIWEAFARVEIEEHDPQLVAADLEMSANALRLARHRVVTRLREKIGTVEDGRWEAELADS